MFGIDFARPKEGIKLKMAWDMLHKLNFGVFGQIIVMPLLHKHHILTQVAGYHVEVIKFLPPMTITQEDMDWFLSAMEDVLADTQRDAGGSVGNCHRDCQTDDNGVVPTHAPFLRRCAAEDSSSGKFCWPFWQSSRHPLRSLIVAGVVLAGCVTLAMTRLDISSDQNKLFSTKVKFFRDYLEFDEKFPENEAV